MPNPIVVQVTADTTTGTLNINGSRSGYQTDVSTNASPQTIQWNLQLTQGQSGAFNPLGTDPATSGFFWTTGQAPGGGIFSRPTQPNGGQIQMTDTNPGPLAQGTWTYRLRATVNGTACQTNPPTAMAAPGDPMIRNRPS